MPHRAIAPESLEPRARYALLLHCVSPRPIAFVSTLSPDGIGNLAPFSFFMAGGGNPPSVVISPTTPRSGQPKDTLHNIQETGEYVINVVTFAMRERMNLASTEWPYGISEWEKAGIESAPSLRVKPPRVADSPLAIECRLYQIVPHGEGPLSSNYVIGEVVYYHVAEELFTEEGAVDATRVDYIARMGSDWYARANADSMFEMPRPPRPAPPPSKP